MKIYDYDRTKAVFYAEEWALMRNKKFYNFNNVGGDCTNFISQCIYAGANVMNYTPIVGWFYNSVNDRTPSWTGVNELYNFLINNKGIGPFGQQVQKQQADIGDIIQLGNLDNLYYHSLIISKINGTNIYVCAHSNDALNKPLNGYAFSKLRFIKIQGVRK